MKTQSIPEFLAANKDSGYDWALISFESEIVNPYLEKDDYPYIQVNEDGKCVGKYEGYWIHGHNGELDKKPVTFNHHINLDERGSYYADVRNDKGETVFTIASGTESEEGETSIFEDGFMKHKHDMTGLKSYLVSLSIMDKDDILVNCK